MDEFVLIGNCLLSSELFNICNGEYITKFPFIISIDIRQYESDTSLLKNFFIPECIINSKISPNSFKDSTQNFQKLLKSPILLTISMFTFIKNNEICNQVNIPLLFMMVNNSMNKNTCILLKYIPKNSSRIQILTIKEVSESILSLLIGTFSVDEFTINSIDEIDYLKIIEKKLKFEPINNFESISLSQNESYKENFEKCILKLNTLTFSSNAYTSIKSLLNDDVNCLKIILQIPSFVEIYPVYINKQKDLTSALTTTAFYLYKFENSNWLVFWCPDQSSKFIKFFYSYLQDAIIKLLNMCEITINYCTTIKLKNDLYSEINSQS
ncbi:hypothetical protein cand_003870 [Cryptosporidium andersoni]|uniref:Uncharacterized protein n=1 Tax=Cryptosporidium andersoni TaxID=117008 RepID=A0A1J4MLK2_9CRYT|nr:hypothetical protein cand_003870 [Cryptosporidium andersoni]